MTAWNCHGIGVRLGGAAILRDVTLQGRAGRTTVVVGPSGAGKTTLLRVLAGLTRPNAGIVQFDGADVTDVPPHRRRAAVLFQEPRLLPALDTGGNVAFPLRVRGVGKAERRRRAKDLLDAVGLAGMANRRVRSLSGGEQQRVALARAIAAEPRLLLLDEPTSSVDPPRRADLRRLLRHVQRRFGLTAVVVTHDQAEAAELADDLVVLLDGAVAQAGPPRTVLEQPRSPAVARFLSGHDVVHVDVVDGRTHVAGLPVELADADGRTALALRPDRICIDAQGPWKLRVADVAYRGDHERVELTHAELRLHAHVPVGTAPAVGSVVGVRLPVEESWRIPLGASPWRTPGDA